MFNLGTDLWVRTPVSHLGGDGICFNPPARAGANKCPVFHRHPKSFQFSRFPHNAKEVCPRFPKLSLLLRRVHVVLHGVNS
jgi:hypothetical protein